MFRYYKTVCSFTLVSWIIVQRGHVVVAVNYDCKVGCLLDPMPVTGVDGNTYFNECLAFCQNVKVEASSSISNIDDTYDTTSVITLQQMNRYQKEGFKLVSKRNKDTFSDGSHIENVYNFDGGSITPSEDVTPDMIRALMISYADGLEYAKIYRSSGRRNRRTMVDPYDPYSEDGRRLVTSVSDTTSFPTRAIGQIEFKQGGSSYICTGTIVSRNAILTAGHCTFNTDSNIWTSAGSFSPGRYRDGSGQVVNPFGTWTFESAITYDQYVNSDYGTSNWLSYDFGIMRLKPRSDGCTYVGDVVGFVGAALTSVGDDALNFATITGYPGDKPYGSMWTSGDCSGNAFSCNNVNFYACYYCTTLRPGTSGSSIMDSAGRTLGAHTHGFGNPVTYTGGTIISQQWRMDDLVEWSQLDDTTLPSCSGGGGGDVPTRPPVGFCFSSENTVEVENKGHVALELLRVGDKVRAGDGQFATVYTFGHLDQHKSATFLQFYMEDAEKPLELTGNHLVFVYREGYVKSIAASHVRVGDLLVAADGAQARVTDIGTIERNGVFAPFTTSGDIVINGVVVSNYATVYDEEKAGFPFSFHWIAHSFTAPRRWACTIHFDWCKNETYDEEGVAHWVPKFYQWFSMQHPILQFLLLGFVFPFLFISHVCTALGQYLYKFISLFVLL